MPLAAGLRNILKPDVVVRTTERGGVELREQKHDVNVQVRVLGLPAGFIAIRAERIGQVSKVGDGPWRQICDYLLLVESDNRTDAIFVELKKTQTQAERPREQLRRSLPLWITCGRSGQSNSESH